MILQVGGITNTHDMLQRPKRPESPGPSKNDIDLRGKDITSIECHMQVEGRSMVKSAKVSVHEVRPFRNLLKHKKLL
jgi:hypothetical protein